MRIFFLPTGWTIVLCFVLWIVINFSAAYVCLYLPDKVFNPRSFFYRCHPFEKDGKIYEDIFRVKSWKQLLPDGGGLWKKRGYKKRHLQDFSEENLERFLIEACRGEMTHWLSILSFWIFGLFLPASSTWAMLIYALVANLPCIIAQRYNRPRILRLLEQRRSRQYIGNTIS